MGKHKFISPVIQTLGRPFSVAQIFELFPRFGEKFAKDSLRFSVRNVTNNSAVLGMTLTEHVAQQFGPYRNRCAYVICQASKAGLLAVPQQVHHLGFATSGTSDAWRTETRPVNGNSIGPPSRSLKPVDGS